MPERMKWRRKGKHEWKYHAIPVLHIRPGQFSDYLIAQAGEKGSLGFEVWPMKIIRTKGDKSVWLADYIVYRKAGNDYAQAIFDDGDAYAEVFAQRGEDLVPKFLNQQPSDWVQKVWYGN